MIRSLAELARVTGGVLHGADVAFGIVTTDSRKLDAPPAGEQVLDEHVALSLIHI